MRNHTQPTLRTTCTALTAIGIGLGGHSANATVTTTGDTNPSTSPVDLWNLRSPLFIGNFGTGTLNIADGGQVNNGHAFIGNLAGSTGTATLTGDGSRWNNGGDLFVGYEGTGVLNIQAGGVMNNNAGHGILGGLSHDSSGTVTVEGLGTTGARSQWDNRFLYVGLLGKGTLNIRAGGHVNTGDGYIGGGHDSAGTVMVTGHGSQLNINHLPLFVGYEGTGVLNIQAGGVVNSASGGFIGIDTISAGTATVTGTGSLWNNGGGLNIGDGGTGVLNIQAGGKVDTNAGAGGDRIGDNIGSAGTATVMGIGSQWDNNDGNFFIGNSGAGTLNITDGGEVKSGSSFIGNHIGSSGAATVTGVGSRWNSSALYVGESGTGTVNIVDGGEVDSGESIIGNLVGSTGTVTVAGAGSRWNNNNQLNVGGAGTGTLNVTANGMVDSRSLHVGSSGTGVLNITDGGVVNIGRPFPGGGWHRKH